MMIQRAPERRGLHEKTGTAFVTRIV